MNCSFYEVYNGDQFCNLFHDVVYCNNNTHLCECDEDRKKEIVCQMNDWKDELSREEERNDWKDELSREEERRT
ncbi:MAG: hypothetical protein HZA08_07400 [Nitrospirae bacterium]|nr:hypothetical protein [Nitrospirota bacterium]